MAINAASMSLLGDDDKNKNKKIAGPPSFPGHLEGAASGKPGEMLRLGLVFVHAFGGRDGIRVVLWIRM